MQKLVKGIHSFQANVFASHRILFEQLSDGQHPMALFISCSDSRIIPSLLTQSEPGELFILRNAGNIIPPFGASNGGEAATIEYGISVLGIENIIVCGHSQCGAMTSLLDRESLARFPSVAQWLQHAESTRRIMVEKYAHLQGKDLLTATVQENVLMQLENLRTHPAVASAIARGVLNLHGWAYKIETGQVFEFDPRAGDFLPIVADHSEPSVHAPTETNGNGKSTNPERVCLTAMMGGHNDASRS